MLIFPLVRFLVRVPAHNLVAHAANGEDHLIACYDERLYLVLVIGFPVLVGVNRLDRPLVRVLERVHDASIVFFSACGNDTDVIPRPQRGVKLTVKDRRKARDVNRLAQLLEETHLPRTSHRLAIRVLNALHRAVVHAVQNGEGRREQRHGLFPSCTVAHAAATLLFYHNRRTLAAQTSGHQELTRQRRPQPGTCHRVQGACGRPSRNRRQRS